MKVLVILAHPNPGSFNHAIAKTVADTAVRLGHQAVLHDLYQEGFDPCLPAAELEKEAPLPAALEAMVTETCTADLLAIVHPNYWSRPPAILCGWEDRVLRAGRAYRFVPDGRGGARPEGLLQARTALVFNTANTPQAIEESVYGDPIDVHWRKVVFGLCGVQDVRRLVFSPVILSTPEQRRQWLDQTAELVRTVLAETSVATSQP